MVGVCLMAVPQLLHAQDLIEGEYFFDADPGAGNGTAIAFTVAPQVTQTFNAPVGALTQGYHTVSTRFKDADGEWGITTSTAFFIAPDLWGFPDQQLSFPLVQGEYMIDTDPGVGNGTPFYVPVGDQSSSAFALNAAGLTEGEHRVGVRVKDQGDRWSIAQWTVFEVGPGSGNTPSASFTYTADPQAGSPVNFTSTSGNTTPGTTYLWDFNSDGNLDATGFSTSFTYASPGCYPASLTVVNPLSALGAEAEIGYTFTNGSLQGTNIGTPDLTASATLTATTGRAGDLNGAFEYGPETASFTNGTVGLEQFTVSFWYKGNNTDYALQLFDENGAERFRVQNNAYFVNGQSFAQDNCSNCLIEDGNFHHVAITYLPGSTAGAKRYVDGQLVGESNTVGATSFLLDSLVIGGLDAAAFMDGTLDDLLIYDRPLAESEVAALFNETYASTTTELICVGPDAVTTITADGPLAFCEGEDVVLTAPAGSNYLWSTGETTQSITVSTSGVYDVSFTGTNGVNLISDAVSVDVTPLVDLNLEISAATNGNANGSAAVLTDTYNGLTFTWSNGATTPIATGLLAGSYTVTVDDGTCPQTLSVDVPSATVTDGIQFAEYFFDDNDPGPGNATPIALTQGSPINAFGDVPTTGLDAGYHLLSVRTRDAEGEWGITRTLPFYLNDANEEVVTTPAVDLVNAEYFFDDNDPGPGNANPITASISGTTVSFTEAIATTGLTPGFHLVSVRMQDANGHWGVTTSAPFQIEFVFPPNLPDVLIPIIAAEYFIGEDPGVGSGTQLDVTAGTTTAFPASIPTDGLTEGLYTLSVRTLDVQGNWSITASESFEITTPTCVVPDLSFTASLVDAGSATVLTSTSTNLEPGATLSWDIDNDGVADYTGATASHIFTAPGEYPVTLTIDNGGDCVESLTQFVVVGPVLSTALTADGPIEFCEGGTVTLTAPAGSNYLWNTLETTASITVNQSGLYQVTYTDANGNPAVSESIEATVHPTMDIVLNTNNSTNGASNGSAGVLVSGGSGFSYDFAWSTGATTPIITAVPAGSYTVTVDDGVCPETVTVVVNDVVVPAPQGIVAAEYFFDEADPGPGNATALVVPEGADIVSFGDVPTTGLDAGYHLLSVRMRTDDGKWGITRTLPFYLTDPNDVPDSSVAEDLVAAEYFIDTDPGPGNGTPLAGVTPGTTVSLTDNIDVTGFGSGVHTLNVRFRDAQGRWGITRTANFFIQGELPESLPDVIFPIVEAEYFIGNEDPGVGNATPINVAPGAPISLSTSIDVTGLDIGTYRLSVRVKDQNEKWSQTQTQLFDVVAPECAVPVADFTFTGTTPGSPTNFNSTSGNTLPGAAYAWDFDGDGTADATTASASFTYPAPGYYDVALTVSNGQESCTVTTVQTVFIGTPVDTDLAADGPLSFCEGGAVTLSVPAGATNVLWSNLSTGPSLTVTESGNYSATFTDANGVLQSTNELYVEVLPNPVVDLTVYDATNGNADGSAGIQVSGGNAFSYDYSWTTGSTTAVTSGLAAGSYSVTVDDGVCPVTVPFTVGNQSTGATNLVAAEYFFDADPGVGNGTPLLVPEGATSGAFADVATNGLTPGYHYLSVRFKEADGRWGITRTTPVYLTDPNDGPVNEPLPDVVEAEYFFDDVDPGVGNGTPLSVPTPATSIAESYTIDPSLLGPGEHKISVRVKDANQKWSVTQTEVFNLCNPPSAPTLISASSIEVCLGGDVTLQAENNGFTLVWTAPDGTTFSGTSWALFNLGPDDYGTYTVVQEGDPGCFSLPMTVEITQETIPQLTTPISGPTELCADTDIGVFFVDPVLNADNYVWTLPPGSVIQSGNNTNNISVDFSNVAVGFASIQVEVINACGSDLSNGFVVTFDCSGNDADGDGVIDPEDNCVDTPNTDQADADGDGIGDVCDDCPNLANPDQVLPTWYADNDADGFGDPLTSVEACEAPAGYVADNTDCDDADNTVYPGASGTNSGVDNNCNGIIENTEDTCPFDYNDDGVVNTGDLLIFLSAFGCSSNCEAFDLNADGLVNTADLLIFLSAFGSTCP